MRRTKHLLPVAVLAALLAVPLAAAQNDTGLDVRETPQDGNVNESTGGGEAEESTVAGLSTTVVIILVVLAVLVVALIVAMANRP